MTSLTLYQRLLGKDFYRLPPILQRFHSSPQGGHATGKVAVERCDGLLRHKVADLLHLPNARDDVAMRLQVIPVGNKERWIRHFNQQRLETLQWQKGEYLIERAGPLQLVFKVAADENGLTFRMHNCNTTRKVLFLSNFIMRINAQARGAEDHWKLQVNISTPLLGKIATYRGEIVPKLC